MCGKVNIERLDSKRKQEEQMETNQWMEQAESHILHTYNRYPIVLDHGEGMYLYDTEGKVWEPGICRCFKGAD